MIQGLDKEACPLSLVACLGMLNPLTTCDVMVLNVICGSNVTPTKDVFVTSHC